METTSITGNWDISVYIDDLLKANYNLDLIENNYIITGTGIFPKQFLWT